MAINAVELTPGCPFAGKVRLKERRNGRQLPRNEREREGGGTREHVYNAGLAVAFILLLALPSVWRRADLRVVLVVS